MIDWLIIKPLRPLGRILRLCELILLVCALQLMKVTQCHLDNWHLSVEMLSVVLHEYYTQVCQLSTMIHFSSEYFNFSKLHKKNRVRIFFFDCSQLCRKKIFWPSLLRLLWRKVIVPPSSWLQWNSDFSEYKKPSHCKFVFLVNLSSLVMLHPRFECITIKFT